MEIPSEWSKNSECFSCRKKVQQDAVPVVVDSKSNLTHQQYSTLLHNQVGASAAKAKTSNIVVDFVTS